MRRQVFGLPSLLFINLSITIFFCVFSLAALLFSPTFDRAFVGFCTIVFAIGVLGLFAGFLKALSASRFNEVSLAGVFFLGHQAVPQKTRTYFFVVLAVQILVAVGVAFQAPFSPIAFAVLVPQMGFGLMALHGGFLGDFPKKAER